jgi:competence protein ComEA
MFGLNRREIVIISVLAAFLVAGFAVSAYKKSRPPAIVRIGQFEPSDMIAKAYDSYPTYNLPTVNINTASLKDLMQLDGIGKVLAERIIEYRTINGSFVLVEDIKKVKGISDKLFRRIKDNLRIE